MVNNIHVNKKYNCKILFKILKIIVFNMAFLDFKYQNILYVVSFNGIFIIINY